MSLLFIKCVKEYRDKKFRKVVEVYKCLMQPPVVSVQETVHCFQKSRKLHLFLLEVNAIGHYFEEIFKEENLPWKRPRGLSWLIAD
jgi:hypothetical protein